MDYAGVGRGKAAPGVRNGDANAASAASITRRAATRGLASLWEGRDGQAAGFAMKTNANAAAATSTLWGIATKKLALHWTGTNGSVVGGAMKSPM